VVSIVVNEKTKRQLSMIAELGSLFDQERIDYWLMGGWAVDFHAGRVTRDHDDVDFAVRHKDMPRIRLLLEHEDWKHSPKEDEDGGTGYEAGDVRLELTYLVHAEDGGVYTPLRIGRITWSPGALGIGVLHLGSASCRVVSLGSLRRSKASPRLDHDGAVKDQADHKVLVQIDSED
jgi:hypothetical protein